MQRNYLIISVIFTKGPHAVYLSLPLSTVSSHFFTLPRNTLTFFAFPDADVCAYDESCSFTDKHFCEQKVCDMTRKYYFDPGLDYGDGTISSSGSVPFNETAWKRGLKQPKNACMYWV